MIVARFVPITLPFSAVHHLQNPDSLQKNKAPESYSTIPSVVLTKYFSVVSAQSKFLCVHTGESHNTCLAIKLGKAQFLLKSA